MKNILKNILTKFPLWAAPLWGTGFFLLLSLGFASAQKTEGVVHFDRKMDWIKIIKKLPYLSKEEKDRLENAWKNDPDPVSKMNLYFNANESAYTWGQEQQEYEGFDYKGRNKELFIHRNFATEKRTDLLEVLGKTYIIQDSLKLPEWKILNQIKDIAGYICMKAETYDKIKGQKIVAWFTGDIPVSAGPEQSCGLPGMILELDGDDGSVMITATSVEFKKLDKELTPPKLKGKKANNKEFDDVISKYIQDSIKMNRNPYWVIRY
jgi:GLPGLI family protein